MQSQLLNLLLGPNNPMSSNLMSLAKSAELAETAAQGNTCYDTMSVVWKHTYEQQSKYAAWIRQMHADYKKLT